MALFPFFRDMQGKDVMIIGGGKHALEKIERVLPYGPHVQVIAETFMPEIEILAKEHDEVELLYRSFADSDLDRFPFCVIAAGDDRAENRRISVLCKEHRILVNVVDDQEYCDFVFPSLISKGSLSIGICTNGASPSTGVLLKRKVEAQIPEHVEEILDWLQEKRPAITEAIPAKKQRFAFYYKLSEMCMDMDRPLTEKEFAAMLQDEQEADGPMAIGNPPAESQCN